MKLDTKENYKNWWEIYKALPGLCTQIALHMPLNFYFRGFPSGTVVENLPANARDTGSSPGLGRSHMLRSN